MNERLVCELLPYKNQQKVTTSHHICVSLLIKHCFMFSIHLSLYIKIIHRNISKFSCKKHNNVEEKFIGKHFFYDNQTAGRIIWSYIRTVVRSEQNICLGKLGNSSLHHHYAIHGCISMIVFKFAKIRSTNNSTMSMEFSATNTS